MASDGSAVRLAVDVRCHLGEGVLWHPDRQSLLWFDILRQVLYEADGQGGPISTLGFGEAVSAAGIIDQTTVAVAGASGLWRVNLDTGERSLMAPLEAENHGTRSNDGRVGPGGAFWIGTMGWGREAGAGGLYRYVDGGFETVLANTSCPNCLSFSPDGSRAYYSETFDHRIVVFPLDPQTGAPAGEPDLFVDLSAEGLQPDGAIVDAEGALWAACFQGGQMARFLPDGTFDRAIALPVTQPTCPAFGGPDNKTLFITTTYHGLSSAERDAHPLAGAVLAVDLEVPGLPPYRMA